MRIMTMIIISVMIILVPLHARGYVSTEETNLNVRSEPSITSDIVASLAKNSYVELISCDDGWWYLEYEKGRYGYCAEEYITELNSTVEYYSDGYYESVALDVVDFKQYDPKWGKLKIGYSGENIHNIGCALTCVAMTESYRTDRYITPKDVVNTFAFTKSGAIYWTDNYLVNRSDKYLETIYAELIRGNPVIIESKTPKDITHWVVITGFTGGDELSADKFTINDPGSSKRKLLSDYFDIYPNYSKIVLTNR